MDDYAKLKVYTFKTIHMKRFDFDEFYLPFEIVCDFPWYSVWVGEHWDALDGFICKSSAFTFSENS